MPALMYFAVLVMLFWISIKVFSVNQLPINKLRMILVYSLLTFSQHIMGLFLVDYYQSFIHLFMSIFYIMSLATLADFFIDEITLFGFKIKNFYHYVAFGYGFFTLSYYVRKGNYVILNINRIYILLMVITAFMILHIFYISLRETKERNPYGILCNFILYIGLSTTLFIQVFNGDMGSEIFSTSMLVYVTTVVSYSIIRFYISGNELLPLSREQVIENMDEMLIVVDTNLDILDINRVFKETFDVNENAIGMNLKHFFISLPNVSENIIERIMTDKEASISFFDDNGVRTYSIKMSEIKNSMNRVIGHMVLLYDISKMKEAMDYLEFIGTYDKLTMVHNRNYFDKALEDYDGDEHLPVSILLGDLNGLKIINDIFGHDKGDDFLKDIAEILKRQTIGRDGIVARTGGDEFTVILPKTCANAAQQLADDIDAAVKDKLKDSMGSISIGVATKLLPTDSLGRVYKRADANMYRKKQKDEAENKNMIITNAKRWLSNVSYETEEHYNTIEKYAVMLGEKLGVPANMIADLKNLASLHDIGKYFVPEHILEKPTKLTKEEWEIVQKHTVQGYKLAASTKDLAFVASGILSHHERWDGTGYPQGLKGEQIPYLARIIAVVDAYSVMISSRPYRGPLTTEKALEEIEKNSGTQFDPTIATTFIELLSN